MSKFKCIGSDCPDSCCHQWDIYVNDEEYSRIEQAFESNGQSHYGPGFKADSNGRRILSMSGEGRKCHFMTGGMCSIHSQFGHEVLPKTCQTYPRSYARLGGIVRLTGYTSCPVVAGLLLEDDSPCDIDTSRKLDEASLEGANMTHSQLSAHGLVKEILAFDGFLYTLFWKQNHTPYDGLMFMAHAASVIQQNLSKSQLNDRQISALLTSLLERIDRGVFALEIETRVHKPVVAYLFSDFFQYLIRNYAYHTYYKFLHQTLNTYHEQVNADIPFDADAVSFSSGALFDAFRLNLNRIWTLYGDTMLLCYSNYIRHHLFKFTVVRHSDMLLYSRRLVAILWVYTILIVGHPSLRQGESVDTDGVKEALTSSIYIASRFIEHTALIGDIEKKLDDFGFTNVEGLYALIMAIMPIQHSVR
jgi:hypothetical protein